MKSRESSVAHWLIIAVLVAVTIGLPAIGYADAPDRDIELGIQLSKLSVVLGEPVVATLKLANTGEAPIEVPGGLCLGLMISQDGMSYETYDPNMLMAYRMEQAKPEVLNPGQTKVIQVGIVYAPRLLFPSGEKEGAKETTKATSFLERVKRHHYEPSSRHLAFPKPGQYWLKSAYRKSESLAAAISVMEPEGKDAEAWAQLKSTPYALAVQLPDEIWDADVAVFREFLGLYPDSVYSRHLARALISHLEDRRDSKPLTPEDEDLLNTLRRRYGELRQGRL